MLTLTGTLRAIATLGGGTKKGTGEVMPTRQVVQIEGLDNRGLVQLYTLTVPDAKQFESRVNEQITLPVRAWATGGPVNLVFEDKS